ncbi:MAG: D-alanyl-D-alanine carboxypeptidase/D-alanyl-D-alanine-endopeptidase [Proteobacteria bacterium]|nr:D-alanyl-D-alanine carboxypeptidase/D-alanyl-D-alanine-endopeptidase [Pseudomonadota bacterium]
MTRSFSRLTAPLALALTLCWALPGTAQAARDPNSTDTPLPPDIAEALARAEVPASSVAMVVAPLPPPGTVGGERNPTPTPPPGPAALPRLSWQPDLALNPASVMKVVTTYAGLDLLGPGHFWKTRVYAQGPIQDGVLRGNLLIRGGGDPKLVLERLQDLMRAIQEQGVREVRGDILLDNSVFRLPPHDPAAFDDDPLRPYNAGPDGLLVNFKALVLTFTPDPPGRRVRVTHEPPIAGVDIPTVLRASSGPCGDWRSRLGADFTQPGQVRLGGRYSMRCGVQQWAVAYVDPASYAPRVIEAMWRAGGGQLGGQVKWVDRPPEGPAIGQPVVTGYSLPLMEIIGDINRFSNNVMAQQLFLTLSAAGSGHGSFTDSRDVLARWWRRRFGTRPAPPVIDNGSGLSRDERVSASALTALLARAAEGPNAAVFEQSLSLAGVNGTARRLAARNPHSEAIGNARLKTGSLRDVAAVAGYAWGRSGQKYTVVGLINHPNAGAARPALDKLVEWAVRDAP